MRATVNFNDGHEYPLVTEQKGTLLRGGFTVDGSEALADLIAKLHRYMPILISEETIRDHTE